MILKKGDKIYLKNDLMRVISVEFVNPGKGKAFTRVGLKSLTKNITIGHTFKHREKVDFAHDVEDIISSFAYQERDYFVFTSYNDMTFELESFYVSKDILSQNKDSMILNALDKHVQCNLLMQNKNIISLSLPKQLTFKVIEIIDHGSINDTSSPATKKVKITTDIVLKVPHFICLNDLILFDTENYSYVSRVL